jgi:hypothetical protein
MHVIVLVASTTKPQGDYRRNTVIIDSDKIFDKFFFFFVEIVKIYCKAWQRILKINHSYAPYVQYWCSILIKEHKLSGFKRNLR